MVVITAVFEKMRLLIFSEPEVVRDFALFGGVFTFLVQRTAVVKVVFHGPGTGLHGARSARFFQGFRRFGIARAGKREPAPLGSAMRPV